MSLIAGWPVASGRWTAPGAGIGGAEAAGLTATWGFGLRSASSRSAAISAAIGSNAFWSCGPSPKVGPVLAGLAEAAGVAGGGGADGLAAEGPKDGSMRGSAEAGRPDTAEVNGRAPAPDAGVDGFAEANGRGATACGRAAGSGGFAGVSGDTGTSMPGIRIAGAAGLLCWTGGDGGEDGDGDEAEGGAPG